MDPYFFRIFFFYLFSPACTSLRSGWPETKGGFRKKKYLHLDKYLLIKCFQIKRLILSLLSVLCIALLGFVSLVQGAELETSAKLSTDQAADVNSSASMSLSTTLIHYDLPGQALASALVEFALQSGVTIATDRKVLAGYRSTPLIGPYPLEKALERLFSQTALRCRFVTSLNAYIVEPKAGGLSVQKEVGFTGASPTAESSESLEEIFVRGVRYPFRYTTASSSQVHGGLSTFDVSRFVNVIPRELIEDQQPQDLADLLRNTSGVTPADGAADTNDDFYIRGFRRNATYVDGFRLDEAVGVKLLPINIERVEILKGPSTLLYGQAEPGGVVNVVRKKPMYDGLYQVSAGYGNEGQKELNLDVTGGLSPQSKSKNTLGGAYRVIYANHRRDLFRDSMDLKRELVSPSLSWRFSENTIAHLGYDYQRSQQTRDQGTIVLTPDANGINLVAVDQPPSQARPDFESRSHMLHGEIIQYVSPLWRLKGKFVSHREDRMGVRGRRDTLLQGNVLIEPEDIDPADSFVIVGGIVVPIPVGTDIGGDQLFSVATIRSLYDEDTELDANQVHIDLQGSFSFWGSEHHVLLGGAWQQQDTLETTTLEERRDLRSLSLGEGGNTNIFDLVEAVFNSNNERGDLTRRAQRLRYDDYGLFAQNSVEFNPHWVASMGVRYTVTEGRRFNIQTGEASDLERFSELSTDLGLVYRAFDEASFYLNYSEAMQANYQIDDTGTNIEKPELSDQWELGTKAQLLDGRLSATAAVFNIRKQNVVNIDFDEGLRVARFDGELETQGLDVDLSYQANSFIDVVAAFSHVDAEVLEGENRGNTPALVAERTASMFANIRLPQSAWGVGFLKGSGELSFNAGAYHVGRRPGDEENSFFLDAYTTVDFGISYRAKLFSHNYKASLTAKNIFDKEYLSAVEGGIRANQGAGRSALFSLSVSI